MNARYQYTDIKDVVDKQHHQNVHQKADLLAFLKQNENLFDFSLGVYPHSKVQCRCISSPCPTSTCPHSSMNWTIKFNSLFYWMQMGKSLFRDFQKWWQLSAGLVTCINWMQWLGICNFLCLSVLTSYASTCIQVFTKLDIRMQCYTLNWMRRV